MEELTTYIQPSVTNEVVVLIPHFNNYKGLKIALKSIKETIPFDVVVVDDGSTKDQIDQIDIKSVLTSASGLSIIRLSQNQGIEHALNTGLTHIKKKKYTFIARLDCDDRNRELRLEKQINYLKTYPNTAIVGSQVQFINKQGDSLYKLNLPAEDKDIRNKMYLNAMLIHPTIVFRTKILDQINGYPTSYKAAEDYAFFWAILKLKKYKMANLKDTLVDCIIDENGISTLQRDNQLKSRLKLIKENFKWQLYPILGLLKTIITIYTPFKLLLRIKSIVYGR